jgi:hypothetical protein
MSEPSAPHDALPRNSEGLTVAESWRKDAEHHEYEARIARATAAAHDRSAARYRELADKWERERLGREWSDLQAGDLITLRVFDHQEGWVRERREVVAVNWPIITFRDGDREYDFDCSQGQKVNRDIRLVPR